MVAWMRARESLDSPPRTQARAMILTLKKLKVSRSLSEETLAYAADVFLDGKPVGYARNDGQGGNALFRTHAPKDREAAATFEAELKALPPKLDEGFDMQDRNIEDAIDTLAVDMDNEKVVRAEIRKLTKNATAYIINAGLMSINRVGPAIEARILQEHPDAKILNRMSIEDAIACYMTRSSAP